MSQDTTESPEKNRSKEKVPYPPGVIPWVAISFAVCFPNAFSLSGTDSTVSLIMLGICSVIFCVCRFKSDRHGLQPMWDLFAATAITMFAQTLISLKFDDWNSAVKFGVMLVPALVFTFIWVVCPKLGRSTENEQ